MSEQAIVYTPPQLSYHTGLTVATLILVPALASRLGVVAAVTDAMRMAWMRALSRKVNKGKSEECGDGGAGFSCH